jgi:hypothetical protein
VTPFPTVDVATCRCRHRRARRTMRPSEDISAGQGSGYADQSCWNPTASIMNGGVPLAKSTEGQIVGVPVVAAQAWTERAPMASADAGHRNQLLASDRFCPGPDRESCSHGAGLAQGHRKRPKAIATSSGLIQLISTSGRIGVSEDVSCKAAGNRSSIRRMALFITQRSIDSGYGRWR